MPEFKCKFCSKEYKNEWNKNAHERLCKLNPESHNYKPEFPPIDAGKVAGDAPIGKDEKNINLGSLGSILKGLGITDGPALINTIDAQARQMPFYTEIMAKMTQMEGIFTAEIAQVKGIMSATNKGVDEVLTTLKRAKEQPSQPATQTPPANQAPIDIPPANQPVQPVQPVVQNQPVATGGAVPAPKPGLYEYANLIFKAMEVSKGGGNPSPQPKEKYSELLAVANLLKTIQGDPVKQLTEGFKVFSDMQKNAVNIARGLPATSTTPTNPIKPVVIPKTPTEHLGA